jgi:hypothetical protein
MIEDDTDAVSKNMSRDGGSGFIGHLITMMLRMT